MSWTPEQRARCRADADFYAVKRARARMWYAAMRVRQGKPYSPRPQCRIPDTERMGRGPDAASAFLPENATPSRRAFARELARERRAAKYNCRIVKVTVAKEVVG